MKLDRSTLDFYLKVVKEQKQTSANQAMFQSLYLTGQSTVRKKLRTKNDIVEKLILALLEMWGEDHKGEKMDDDLVQLIADHLHYAFMAGADVALHKLIKDLEVTDSIRFTRKFLIDSINALLIE